MIKIVVYILGVSCSDVPTSLFSTYIKYSHTGNTNLEFSVKQEIGDDLDNGDVAFGEVVIHFLQIIVGADLLLVLFFQCVVRPKYFSWSNQRE